MKKIIFTVTNDLVFDQRMQRICATLAASGYNVTLTGRKTKTSPLLTLATFNQKRIHCWTGKGKVFYLEFNIRLFFYLLFKRTDCVCAIDLDTILPCWLVSKLKNVKRVYDAHEFFSQLDEVISRPAVYKVWHWIEKKMIPRFPRGYTVCESLAAEFKKNYKAEYEVIRNMPLLSESQETIRNKKIILYQGAVNKGRGLEKLVAAMKAVNASLWVCGNGNFIDEMKIAAKENGIEHKIVFWGMLKPADLKQKTAEAYIAINPFEKRGLNQYLSLANKFFDYIHAGVPQVTMNYPEYRKINDEYKIAVLIDDLLPTTLADTINRLLNDKTLYESIQKNTLAARKELNWQKESEKLLKFYGGIFNE